MQTLETLTSLRDRFLQNEHEETVLVTKESGTSDTDMLTTLHHPFGKVGGTAQGLYYFDDDPDIPLFICRLILGADISEDLIVPLCTQISLLNPLLPLGAFSFDAISDTLEYTVQVPVEESWSKEELLEEADLTIALSLSIAEQNVHSLQEIIGG